MNRRNFFGSVIGTLAGGQAFVAKEATYTAGPENPFDWPAYVAAWFRMEDAELMKFRAAFIAHEYESWSAPLGHERCVWLPPCESVSRSHDGRNCAINLKFGAVSFSPPLAIVGYRIVDNNGVLVRETSKCYGIQSSLSSWVFNWGYTFDFRNIRVSDDRPKYAGEPAEKFLGRLPT